MITVNIVQRDQRLPPARQNRDLNRGADVKKSRRHRTNRALDGQNKSLPQASPDKHTSQPGPSSPTPGPLQRNPDSASSGGSRRSQLIDLVVENTEAEEEDRARTQRAYGSAHAEPEPRRFS